jgi:hypothetical protein
MATVTKGRTFVSGEVVTPTKLNNLVDLATVTQIVNADISATAEIVDTKLATISTAGKVANSATTATAANTASAIVTRDSSGNFLAGTIAANLIGNVTGNVTGSATSLASFGSKFLPKAWVNFQGNLGAITPNTYSQSYNATTNITTVTVNTTKAGGHGLSTGDFITITASTSGVVNGTWQVNVISSGTLTFAVTGTLAATVAAATVNPILVRSSINVSKVHNLGTGIYQLDFGASSSVSITALSCTGTTATATATNTLSVGSFIVISGASVAGYNGRFQVTAASASSFSYVVASSLAAATTATGIVTVAGAIFADANYVTTGSVRYQNAATGSRMGMCSDSRTTSSTRILTNYHDGNEYDMFEVSAVFFGN